MTSSKSVFFSIITQSGSFVVTHVSSLPEIDQLIKQIKLVASKFYFHRWEVNVDPAYWKVVSKYQQKKTQKATSLIDDKEVPQSAATALNDENANLKKMMQEQKDLMTKQMEEMKNSIAALKPLPTDTKNEKML